MQNSRVFGDRYHEVAYEILDGFPVQLTENDEKFLND